MTCWLTCCLKTFARWISARLPRALVGALTLGACAIAVLLLSPLPVGAHAELERAEPPPDALLAAPPRELRLWMTERVAQEAGSPSIRVLDESGEPVAVTDVRVSDDNPRQIVARISGLSTGTYTVMWTVRSADDGHTLTGSYGFRIGTGRAPGAATVEGELPRGWAVAARWLTFLGAAIAAAGFLFRVAVAGTDSGTRRTLTLGAAVIALVATLIEPVLQTRFPPAGATRPDLSEAIAGLPSAWWLRPAGLAIAVALAIAAIVMRRRPIPSWMEIAGGLAAGVALLGLAGTSHAAARETWREVSTLSIVLHQIAIGLWVGGLVCLGLDRWERRGEPTGADPVRRFSRLALFLALVGIGTGVVNAGFILPTLRSLWESDYGKVLLIKVAILVPVLALATFHRLALRRALSRATESLRTTIRVEAALAMLVVLGGSGLALLAPPAVATGTLTAIDLAAPPSVDAESDLVTRLKVSPAKPGDNEVSVFFTTLDGAPVPASEVALVRLDFQSLDHEAEQRGIVAEPAEGDVFVTKGVQLSLNGWWRVNVLVRRLGQSDLTVPFYLLLPDPNIHGMDAPDVPEGSPDAEALYQRGLASLTSLQSVRWSQRLTGGTGTAVILEFAVRASNGDEPPAMAIRSRELESIQIGDQRWQRQPGGDWIETEAGRILPPSAWGETYEGATGFRLGITEEINGEPVQVVTFHVPATDRYVAAWYAWWIGQESGQLYRLAMISRLHYMIDDYSEFNEPLTIAPPTS